MCRRLKIYRQLVLGFFRHLIISKVNDLGGLVNYFFRSLCPDHLSMKVLDRLEVVDQLAKVDRQVLGLFGFRTNVESTQMKSLEISARKV
jgi:hypothetical protein